MHLHVHLTLSDELSHALTDLVNGQRHQQVVTLLNQILEQGAKIMAADQAQFDALLKRIDDSTTKGALVAKAISDELKALRDAVKTGGGLTAAQEEAIATRLGILAGASEQLTTFLEATGKPAEPAPVPPPPPPPPPPLP